MGVSGGKAMVLATDSVSNSWLHKKKGKFKSNLVKQDVCPFKL